MYMYQVLPGGGGMNNNFRIATYTIFIKTTYELRFYPLLYEHNGRNASSSNCAITVTGAVYFEVAGELIRR